MVMGSLWALFPSSRDGASPLKGQTESVEATAEGNLWQVCLHCVFFPSLVKTNKQTNNPSQTFDLLLKQTKTRFFRKRIFV